MKKTIPILRTIQHLLSPRGNVVKTEDNTSPEEDTTNITKPQNTERFASQLIVWLVFGLADNELGGQVFFSTQKGICEKTPRRKMVFQFLIAIYVV